MFVNVTNRQFALLQKVELEAPVLGETAAFNTRLQIIKLCLAENGGEFDEQRARLGEATEIKVID